MVSYIRPQARVKKPGSRRKREAGLIRTRRGWGYLRRVEMSLEPEAYIDPQRLCRTARTQARGGFRSYT